MSLYELNDSQCATLLQRSYHQICLQPVQPTSSEFKRSVAVSKCPLLPNTHLLATPKNFLFKIVCFFFFVCLASDSMLPAVLFSPHCSTYLMHSFCINSSSWFLVHVKGHCGPPPLPASSEKLGSAAIQTPL